MDLKTQLIEFEGKVPHAYIDSLGFVSIGVGRLIDKRKGGRLTDDEIDYLLENDIRRHTEQVIDALPWVADLDEPRKAVLIGMAFQMGLQGLLGFPITLSAVKEGRYADAARGMRNSKWAQQTPARVNRLAKQMETGEWS
jgi:lysozyme